MPIGQHRVDIKTTTECVLQLGARRMPVEVYQAKCECAWQGPRRLRFWEADDDASNHQSNPQEGQ